MNVIRLLAMLVMGLAWLVPNHYLPWLAFHGELAAAIAVTALGLTLLRSEGMLLKWPWLAVMILALSLVPLIQVELGLIKFAGSGYMASLYLAGFALSMVIGNSVAMHQTAVRMQGMAWTVLAAALISSGIILYQWQRLQGLGYWVIDIENDARPFSNLGQPNQAATLLYWGFIAATLLFQHSKLGLIGLISAMVLLSLGMAATQSRSGLLECMFFIVMAFYFQKKFSLRVHWVWLLLGFVVLVGASIFLGRLGSIMLLSLPQNEGERLSAGTRPDHWIMLLDAISRHPWFGYGWDQVAQAHLSVALSHPAIPEYQEHSHNLIMDLLIWNGIPLGIGLVLALFFWFWQQFRGIESADAFLILMAISGVFIHAMLEYPLEYAYFLLPTGLMMGMLNRVNIKENLSFMWSKIIYVGIFFGCSGVLACVVMDYIKIEESYRDLRMQSARIGGVGGVGNIPDVFLLTQLRDLLAEGRSKAHQNMTIQELEHLKEVSSRYPVVPMLMKYALASGLNQRPDIAADTLQTLCKRHPRHLCDRAMDGWLELTDRHPQLKLVALPKDRNALPMRTPGVDRNAK